MTEPDKNGVDSPFDALMDAAVDAIIVIEANGTIRRFNQAAQKLFGYALDEVLNRNVKMLMPEPDRRQHDGYLHRYKVTKKASIIGAGRETNGQRKNGTVFPMQLSVGEIQRAEGTNYFVGIIRDLTEQKLAQEQVHQLEEQLLHADRLVILGELTAGIAHEINQPLTAIAAYADAGKSLAAKAETADPQDLQQICERIGEQARRAGQVVRRLRKLVRTGTLSKAPHDLNQIIRNILLLFEYELNKSKIELDFVPGDSLETLYLDEVQVQQIMVNLVKNSIDAIVSAQQADGHIEIHVQRIGKEVVVSVSDNGPGVPEAYRRRLFESFFTTKPKGVGLGLSICKNIAAAHGGSLSYEAPLQGGSRFLLKLPLELIG